MGQGFLDGFLEAGGVIEGTEGAWKAEACSLRAPYVCETRSPCPEKKPSAKRCETQERKNPGRNFIHPPPFLAKRQFSGEGGGDVYFEPPRGRNFIRPAPFIHPPTPRKVFSGVGGWGCIKFGPATKKQPKEKVSGRISRGRPGVIRADVPGQKLRAGHQAFGGGHP